MPDGGRHSCVKPGERVTTRVWGGGGVVRSHGGAGWMDRGSRAIAVPSKVKYQRVKGIKASNCCCYSDKQVSEVIFL